MRKSGLIFGAISVVIILGTTLVSTFCSPCVGLFLGLAAGYVAGVFDKPVTSRDSVRIGGIAGLIAGSLGLIGELIGTVINISTINAAAVEQIFKTFGIPGVTYTQSELTTYQWIGGICFGMFNILWMAIFGIAGAALWYQNIGKNQIKGVIPPQGPIPPSLT